MDLPRPGERACVTVDRRRRDHELAGQALDGEGPRTPSRFSTSVAVSPSGSTAAPRAALSTSASAAASVASSAWTYGCSSTWSLQNGFALVGRDAAALAVHGRVDHAPTRRRPLVR